MFYFCFFVVVVFKKKKYDVVRRTILVDINLCENSIPFYLRHTHRRREKKREKHHHIHRTSFVC